MCQTLMTCLMELPPSRTSWAIATTASPILRLLPRTVSFPLWFAQVIQGFLTGMKSHCDASICRDSLDKNTQPLLRNISFIKVCMMVHVLQNGPMWQRIWGMYVYYNNGFIQSRQISCTEFTTLTLSQAFRVQPRFSTSSMLLQASQRMSWET